jgi:hypothetical protein
MLLPARARWRRPALAFIPAQNAEIAVTGVPEKIAWVLVISISFASRGRSSGGEE